jgi:ribonuclease P protein component
MRTAVLGDATQPPQIAFAVRRSVGNAVCRNRVRRRLDAAMREHRDLLERGHGYLLRPDARAATATYGDLSATVRAALVELHERAS